VAERVPPCCDPARIVDLVVSLGSRLGPALARLNQRGLDVSSAGPCPSPTRFYVRHRKGGTCRLPPNPVAGPSPGEQHHPRRPPPAGSRRRARSAQGRRRSDDPERPGVAQHMDHHRPQREVSRPQIGWEHVRRGGIQGPGLKKSRKRVTNIGDQTISGVGELSPASAGALTASSVPLNEFRRGAMLIAVGSSCARFVSGYAPRD
jgi:hypothetical protein